MYYLNTTRFPATTRRLFILLSTHISPVQTSNNNAGQFLIFDAF